MKTRHCDECKRGIPLRNKIHCEAGHKPRFYAPRALFDTSYGWKRKCADFVEAVKEFAEWYDERSGDGECRQFENLKAALAKVGAGTSSNWRFS